MEEDSGGGVSGWRGFEGEVQRLWQRMREQHWRFGGKISMGFGGS